MSVVSFNKKKNWAKRERSHFTIAIFMLCLGLGSAQAYASDADFNAALAAANADNLSALDNYQASMQDSVLAYYPEYWKLNSDLVLQPVSAILDFVKKYPNTAMAEKLAADYIEAKVLAGDYTSAKPLIGSVTNPDDAENCAIVQVQASSGDTLALSAYKNVWLTTNKQPDTCAGLSRFLLNSPMMSNKDRQQRLWVMLRSGQLGNAVSTAQTMGIAISNTELSSIAASPLSYLQTAVVSSSTDQAKFLYALARLADTSVDAAASQLEISKSKLPDDAQRYAYRILGYKAGTSVLQYGFNPKSVEWFDRSYGYPFSDEEAEVYARQSVRFGKWESLLRAVDSMSLTMQQQRVWQYWYARANEQRGDDKSRSVARAFYTNLALTDDYHGLLARDRLGQKFNQLSPSYTPTASDFQRLDRDTNFQKAFTLKNINASAAYANREWNWAVRQARLKNDDGLILAAASRANDMSWYDRAIYAAEKTNKLHNYNLQFVMPFRDQVVDNCSNNGIDAAWVYGLMRQESRFVMTARSGVGAGGLMQIMPDTARWVARKLGEAYNSSALSSMRTNIRYGTFYLSHIHNQLSNQPVLATAGYNAGPNRAKRWQPVEAPLASDQYTESIPLSETRDYVKNVMTNAVYYGLLLGGGAQSLSQRMGEIPIQVEQGW